MKIKIPCVKCVADGSIERESQELLYEYELTDERVYSLNCNEGHETVVIFDTHVYELLFDMGLYALADGYSREAVANFAAAIERFHEFSINVFIAKSLSSYLYLDEFPKAWKGISSQSERQLGAYVMLYLAVFKRSPELMPQKNIEFRNNVIHKGKFPTVGEAMKYAESTFNYIKQKLVEMKKELDDEVLYVHDHSLREYIIKNSGNCKHVVHWSELVTFKPLRPVEEIETLSFKESFEKQTRQRIFYN
ncbi:hypothetical protein [Paenibacillus vulneris]|uniref:Cthe-2314-like HEPN domain-containing protein n=1 Tax=Paenibacillus vulneris TaxID=1133364 RepID=A0ABW3UKF0_9BACL